MVDDEQVNRALAAVIDAGRQLAEAERAHRVACDAARALGVGDAALRNATAVGRAW